MVSDDVSEATIREVLPPSSTAFFLTVAIRTDNRMNSLNRAINTRGGGFSMDGSWISVFSCRIDRWRLWKELASESSGILWAGFWLEQGEDRFDDALRERSTIRHISSWADRWDFVAEVLKGIHLLEYDFVRHVPMSMTSIQCQCRNRILIGHV